MTDPAIIPFNKPYLTGDEVKAVESALSDGKIHGDGRFTKQCHEWFVQKLGASSAYLTGSCTLGLEMATLVANINSGDEVLVPDFTFVSTAQCVALRGATPVLCDVRHDTLNIDETRLAEALTSKTKAIMPVHYAGVSAEMNAIREFANEHNLLIIEDAAQAIGCSYHNKPVGTIGDMSVFSFHSTKNVHCGEGGMVVVNNPEFSERCSIAWEKGTDRRRFLEGNVEKYQWQELGSSFLASEITAAMLSVQLAAEGEINTRRRDIWQRYDDVLGQYSTGGKIGTPSIPEGVEHNGHLYFIVLPDQSARTALISELKEQKINAVFHYTPLHESSGGKRYCRQGMDLRNASELPHRLLRLPLYPDLSIQEQDRVIETVSSFVERM